MLGPFGKDVQTAWGGVLRRLGTVEPAGWNPRLPVRVGAEKVQLEAGGASYA